MNNDYESKNKIVLIIAAVVIVLSLFFLFFYKNNQPKVSIEGQDIDTSKQVSVSNGRQLTRDLGSLESLNYLSEDLYVFAKTAYPTDELHFVGFVVGDEIKKSENLIEFEGSYEPIGGKIEVKVYLLKNSRIKVSITDTSSMLNIDNFLPSNTKRNQFIGTLPVSSNDYSIDFEPKGNGFIISLYADSGAELDSAYDKAEGLIREGLGVENLNYEQVNITRGSF